MGTQMYLGMPPVLCCGIFETRVNGTKTKKVEKYRIGSGYTNQFTRDGEMEGKCLSKERLSVGRQ